MSNESRSWTKEENRLFIKYYPKEGPAAASRFPGRTESALKNHAQQLGLLYRGELRSWTDEELRILKTYYPKEGKRVAERLPGRSVKTIQTYAHNLGVRRRPKKSKTKLNKKA